MANAAVSTQQPGFSMGSATSGKVGMWIFLLSDAFSFGGLLLGYAILRAGAHELPPEQGSCTAALYERYHCWPDPTLRLGIPFTGVMTFVLILSSVFMVLALAGAHEKNKKALCGWLAATIGGGLFFLGGQVYEYTHLIHGQGATFTGDQMWSTFFLTTSFHGAHVTTGVIYLTVILIQALSGKFTDGPNASPNLVEIAGLFWHFVDLVWILVFTFIYLI